MYLLIKVDSCDVYLVVIVVYEKFINWFFSLDYIWLM